MSVPRGARLLLAAAFLLSACSTSNPEPTPYPTSAPRPSLTDAEATVSAFLDAWDDRSYVRLFGLLAAGDRQRTSLADVREVLATFDELANVHQLQAAIGEPVQVALPPLPLPPPSQGPTSPTPVPSGGLPGATATSAPSPSPIPIPPGTPPDGPVPGLAFPVELRFATGNFGDVELDRQLVVTEGANGWEVRWDRGVLFPELRDGGTLRLDRDVPARGRIVGLDGTVWAETRDDGVRIYPQEWLAGQTIGYVGKMNADDLVSLEREGWRGGDTKSRIGLELGADQLLRGKVGFTLSAVVEGGDPVELLRREPVPGADVTITLRRSLQATTQAQIAGYSEAGTAVLDPRSGDVWALASAPVFNPNAMTLGTTLAGQALQAPGVSALTNHAISAGYPAGSSFKVFTLAAALQTGVAGPQTRMPCEGTWTYSGFTFRNYLEHRLPGLVDLKQAMAFSCNTTYMPLSVMVYEENKTALTDLVRDFGFGQLTGMRYLAHGRGILPDPHFFEITKRWDGVYREYGPFDQIQLAIGQGSYLGTSLQLANAYSAIGNGGTLWTPRIVARAELPDGTLVEEVPNEARRQIPLTEEQLAYVVDSMQAVVDYSYGTAHYAFVGLGIPVAGKSGTAETGGPNPDAWFPAIAPADDPEISVATVLVRVPLATGGSDAAPLVRRVIAQYWAER